MKMKKLHMGTEVIAIKDAMTQVQKNIEKLTFKKESVNLNGYAGKKILAFYEEKIALQSATLIWLKKAL
ncbi:MAG: hypothetical protein EOP48_19180 [Sphingobacteriales bacterium]|nr:MAG: hypothetical protein EOP48_19180 [Sphingobacteriales bacterium]